MRIRNDHTIRNNGKIKTEAVNSFMLQWLGYFPAANKLYKYGISEMLSLLDCHPARD